MLLFSPNSLLSALSYPRKNKRLAAFYNKCNISYLINVSFLYMDRAAKQIQIYDEVRIFFIGFLDIFLDILDIFRS